MHVVDILLIVLFVAGTIVAGFFRVSKSFVDFAVGDKKFSNFSQIATIVATRMSGSVFFVMLTKIYEHGLSYFLVYVGDCVSLIIVGIFIIPRVEKFLKHTSVAESLGEFCGNKVKMITSTTGIFLSAGVIAAQFKILGNIIQHFTNIPPTYSILCTGLLITLYSTTGGLRSVTYTDIIQFLSFVIVVPIVGLTLWHSLENKELLLGNTTSFDISKWFYIDDSSSFLSMFSLFLYCAAPALNPSMYQRILMGNSIDNTKRNFILSGIILFLLYAFIAFIPICLKFLDANLQPDKLIKYVIENYTYIFFSSILMIGILSMAMSTADSHINAASVLFAGDIIKVKNTNRKKLFYAKSFSLFIGILAILLALAKKDILDILLSTSSYYIALVSPIIVSVILGFRTEKYFVLLSMILTAIFITIVLILHKGTVPSEYLAAGILFNTTVLFSLHYIFNHKNLGWIGNIDNVYLTQQKMEKEKNKVQKKYFFQNFNLINFFLQQTPKEEKSYFLLGIYLIFSVLLTIYTQENMFQTHTTNMLVMYEITIISGLLLSFYPVWSRVKYSQKIASILWFFSIFTSLCVFNFIWGIFNNFQGLPLVIVTANLFVSFFLLGWRLAIVFFTIGLLSAAKVYGLFFDSEFMGASLLPIGYIFGFIILLISIFIAPHQRKLQTTEGELVYTQNELVYAKNELLFTKEKLQAFLSRFKSVQAIDQMSALREKEIEVLSRVKCEFLDNLKSYTRSSVLKMSSLAEAVYDDLFYYTDKGNEQHEEVKEQITKIITDSKNTLLNIDNIIIHSELDSGLYKLRQTEMINLLHLLKHRIEICSTIFCAQILETGDKQVLVQGKDTDNNLSLTCDPFLVGFLLDNVLVHAITQAKSDIAIEVKNIETISVDISFVFAQDSKEEEEFNPLGYELSKKILEKQHGTIEIYQNADGKSVINVSLHKKSTS